jgi:hypothetical protein
MQKNECGGKRASGARRLVLASLVALLASAGAARADDYDPHRAGHPLRIVAYALHPVGFMIDYVILRPAHWFVSHEPWRSMFGHTD